MPQNENFFRMGIVVHILQKFTPLTRHKAVSCTGVAACEPRKWQHLYPVLFFPAFSPHPKVIPEMNPEESATYLYGFC